MAVHPEQPGDAVRKNPGVEILERLWEFLTSSSCAAILFAVAALLVSLSVLFPQIPPTLSDPNSRLRWLAEATSSRGALGPTLQAMGMFHLQESLLWKAVLGIGVLILLVRLEVHVRQALGLARADLSRMKVRFREETSRVGASGEVLDGVISRLEREGFRTRTEDNRGLREVHAARQPQASWLWASLHLGLLLLVVSLLVAGAVGQAEQIALGPGESAHLEMHAGWSALLRGFSVDPDTPALSRGEIAVLGPEANVVVEGAIGTQRPLWAGDLTLHMSGTGPGLRASATGDAGQPVTLQPASGASQSPSLFLRFDEDQPEQYFAVPEIEHTVRVALHPDAGNGPEFLIQVYRGAEVQPTAERMLAAEDSLEADGVTYRFTPSRYPTLMTVRNPALWALWTGAALTVLSALLIQFFRAGGVLVRAFEVNGEARFQVLADDEAAGHAVLRSVSGTEQTVRAT